MSLSVRNARPADLPAILTVLEAARGIMAGSGNLSQWRSGYPAESDILCDIAGEGGFVVLEGERIAAYFAFLPSPEPTYSIIYEGRWLDDTRPYHVIHRIASVPEVHGIFRTILDWCAARDGNLRIDTHRDNRIMQHCILSYGFRYCGIIHLANGDERLAYQMPELNSHNKEEYPPMHTAGHILNATMVRLFGCPRSRNAHIERKKSKCDYLLEACPTDEQVAQIERTVNEVIGRHLDVTVEFVPRAEAAAIVDLSKLPENVSETLRIVRVGDYDACACIGAHVRNTAEIGTFRILSHDFEDGRWRVRWKVTEP